jgi:hypothetical protein
MGVSEEDKTASLVLDFKPLPDKNSDESITP